MYLYGHLLFLFLYFNTKHTKREGCLIDEHKTIERVVHQNFGSLLNYFLYILLFW